MAIVLSPRSVGLMLAAAVAASWMEASVTQRPAPAQSPGATALGSPVPMPRAENLRERLSEPPLPSRGRNPFKFGSRASVRSTSFRDRAATPAEQPEMAAVEPSALPIIRLSGIASNVEGGATMLTAILSDNGAMVFAKAGDKLSNGYSVVRVEETSVTLVDSTGVTQTIRLP